MHRSPFDGPHIPRLNVWQNASFRWALPTATQHARAVHACCHTHNNGSQTEQGQALLTHAHMLAMQR